LIAHLPSIQNTKYASDQGWKTNAKNRWRCVARQRATPKIVGVALPASGQRQNSLALRCPPAGNVENRWRCVARQRATPKIVGVALPGQWATGNAGATGNAFAKIISISMKIIT